jgi:hypothetical protein
LIFIVASVILLLFSKYNISVTPLVITTREVADLIGKVELNNSCITVTDGNNLKYTLVWPQQYEVIMENRSILIFDYYLDTNVTWRNGENINIRGKAVKEIISEEVQEINPNCPGPFWIVSGWYK